MLRHTLLAFATAAVLAPTVTHAQDRGDWLVRVRATHLSSANGDSTGKGLTMNNKWLPEFDVTYFFTPNIATELVLTVPQTQTISAQGKAIGTFDHLPPTLMLQYHLTGIDRVRPYLGVGVNHTFISGVKLGGGTVTLDGGSNGLALQAGLDVPLGSGWMFNVDAKKVRIGTGVYAGGAQLGTFRIDPLLISAGLGLRF